MKYEAKAWNDLDSDGSIDSGEVDEDGCNEPSCVTDNWGIATYKPGSNEKGGPWRRIDQINSWNECDSLNSESGRSNIDRDANGDGTYALISNPEWMAIAKNVENVASNWTNGAVGDGCLKRGNIGGLHPCTGGNSGYDGPDPDFGASRADIGTAQLTLSNGEIIWDFSGNVWSWVDWTLNNALFGKMRQINKPYVVADGSAKDDWRELSAINTFTGLVPNVLLQPFDVSFNSTKGVGAYYAGTSGGAAVRGGHWTTATNAGAFALDLNYSDIFTDPTIGFRCVYRTSEYHSPDGPAIFVWRTTTINEPVTLPLRNGFSYSMNVNWGDGLTSEITAYDDPDITHTYSSPGYYLMTMTGAAEAWYFNNLGSKDQLVEVKSLGGMGWKDLNAAFSGCSNLISFAGGDTTNVTVMRSMFKNAASLAHLNLTSFNTSLVAGMDTMFFACLTLNELDLSSFDTSVVSDMSNMFNTASGLVSLDLSNFSTSNVSSMNGTFKTTSSLVSLYTTGWNTSTVNDMSNMFNSASSLVSLNLSHFDTSNVTTLNSTFKNTSSLTSLNTTNWDISLPPTGVDIFTNSHASLEVTCDMGSFFGKTCL